MQADSGASTYKLVLVGSGGAGKTTFMRRHLTGEFEERYIPTVGVEVRPLTFHTTRGPVRFNCWDTAGQEKFMGLADGYYIQADCAVIMFDLTSRASYDSVPAWHEALTRVCGNIPVVLVGTKADAERQVSDDDVDFHAQHGLEYVALSSKSHYHFEQPFVRLLRALKDDPACTLVEPPAVPPHE